MAAQRIAGICFFKINGVQYSARGSWVYMPFTSKKEGIAGQDGIHGFKEMPQVPYVEGEISDMPGISIQDLQTLVGVPATLELANGKLILLHDGWCTGDDAVSTEDGKVKIKIEGMDLIEELP